MKFQTRIRTVTISISGNLNNSSAIYKLWCNHLLLYVWMILKSFLLNWRAGHSSPSVKNLFNGYSGTPNFSISSCFTFSKQTVKCCPHVISFSLRKSSQNSLRNFGPFSIILSNVLSSSSGQYQITCYDCPLNFSESTTFLWLFFFSTFDEYEVVSWNATAIYLNLT